MALSTNTYGKSRVRLVRVRRDAGKTHFVEWSLSILFQGNFESAFVVGDNRGVLPTDTMKNTVYSLARSTPAISIEEFACELCRYFLQNNAETSGVNIEIAEKVWEHLVLDGQENPDCFRLAGNELQITAVNADREHVQIRSGVRDLLLMKTSDSSFAGFKRDRLTTLNETSDRLLGTALRAEWKYSPGVTVFAELRRAARETLLRTFAAHHSLSVQHTLYAMGEAVIAAVPEVSSIKLTMPNLHCLLVDLSPFGQDNPNEVFVPIDEPHGYIEAEIKRD